MDKKIKEILIELYKGNFEKAQYMLYIEDIIFEENGKTFLRLGKSNHLGNALGGKNNMFDYLDITKYIKEIK